ncbi:hypothetical protein [uncultured Methanobrevibacter sp.]|uniref:hypothetical protein n=1 Tax=uncultured Methanobrevibacter sp. TaxID=253161 RepID=UPI0026269968|nr:hypothetical protein [uncultured Methanobrevibacter sp.]
MDVSETIGATISGMFISIICALILAAIVHFFFGDNISSVLLLYILVAFIPSALVNTSLSKSSAIVGSLLAVIIIFLLMNFIFPIIFGPNITFPYSILDLGPIITGLILSLIVGIIAVLYR